MGSRNIAILICDLDGRFDWVVSDKP